MRQAMNADNRYITVEQVNTYKVRFDCASGPCPNFGEVTVTATASEHAQAIAEAVANFSAEWVDGLCPRHGAQ